jgi:hypothetical protein
VVYKFKNKNTDEVHEVEMPMKNYAPYKGPNGNDENWERVYEAPQINMGNSTAKKIDPWDNTSFVDRTKHMKGTYGDLENHSRELSEKRAKESITGEDPLKRKYLNNYAKRRGGKKHMADMPTTFENKHVKVELNEE